jgi:ATP-dependent DNA ligase
VKSKAFSALPAAKITFIEPMYARLVQSLSQGQEWLYEVKFDGYRCLAGRDAKGVTLWSRRENLFTEQFPHIAQAFEQLPPNTLVDGEIVALDESGRVSFNLLQHHRSKAQALLLYVLMSSYTVAELERAPGAQTADSCCSRKGCNRARRSLSPRPVRGV